MKTTAYFSSLHAFRAFTFHSLRSISVQCGKDTNSITVFLKSWSLILLNSDRTILIAIFSKVLWADDWWTCWRPFVSFASDEVHPFLPSFGRYRRIILPKRYLVYKYIIVFISSVRTAINDTAFGHFSDENLTTFILLYTKALLFCKMCSSDPGLLLRNRWRDFFSKTSKISDFKPIYLRTKRLAQKLILNLLTNFLRFIRIIKNIFWVY